MTWTWHDLDLNLELDLDLVLTWLDAPLNTIVTSVEDRDVTGELTAKFWNRGFWRELIRAMETGAPGRGGAKEMSMI